MIKSKSWEISAWNPKDSAMFWVLGSQEEAGVRGEERVEERNLLGGWAIYLV